MPLTNISNSSLQIPSSWATAHQNVHFPSMSKLLQTSSEAKQALMGVAAPLAEPEYTLP